MCNRGTGNENKTNINKRDTESVRFFRFSVRTIRVRFVCVPGFEHAFTLLKSCPLWRRVDIGYRRSWSRRETEYEFDGTRSAMTIGAGAVDTEIEQRTSVAMG